MGNISKYSGTAIYQYLQVKYPLDTDRTNYVYILCSMETKQSVGDLIGIYGKILRKWVTYEYGEEECHSGTWCDYGFGDYYNKEYNSLKDILNKEILRLFENKEYSDKFALECITNLRYTQDMEDIGNLIASKSSEKVKLLVKDIFESKKRILEAWKYLKSDYKGTNGFVAYEAKYIQDMKFLINNGLYRGSDFGSLELATGINYYSFRDIKALGTITATLIMLIFVVFYIFIYLLN